MYYGVLYSCIELILDAVQQLGYQIKLGQGCCFPCIHTPAIIDSPRYNTHIALQDVDVEEQ